MNNNYINREIEEKIKNHLFKKKVILVFGARQTGKTTLVKKILEEYKDLNPVYLNCDEEDIKEELERATSSTQLQSLFGETKLLVIDEAQRVKDIGLKLKLIHDCFPQIQIIATGSSSFQLGQKTNEPLTGRNLKFWLHPFSLAELKKTISFRELKRKFEEFLIFGFYPEIVISKTKEEKQTLLFSLVHDYLFKDILARFGLRGEETAKKLLRALALQLGNEVSLNELASLIGVAKETVASYLQILEQAFIIFRISPFSANIRNTIGKKQKVYFWDVGIRNVLINNLNPILLRGDIGGLFENFVIAEKKKKENFIGEPLSLYFWRSYTKQEIDLIELKNEQVIAYEIKWKKTRKKPPVAWQKHFPNSQWISVNQENFWETI
jgi:predicted AAA+ superfamily ATPase